LGEQLHEAADMKELRELADNLDIAVKHFRLAFGVDPDKQAWIEFSDNTQVQDKYTALEAALQALIDVLDIASERGKGLDNCHKRAIVIKTALKQFKIQSQKDRFIYWYETFRTGFMLNMTPLEVAEPFQKAMKAIPASWIFTSATLTVGGDFSHFKAGLGLRSAQEIMLDSPFNYRDNAILYLPTGLPDPGSADYTLSVMEKMLPVLKASRGRAFLLFTSYRAMNAAQEYLTKHTDFTLLVQQTMPKRELVEAFQSVANAVLLGTSSFWEGVDVRGAALSCVVIEKLPFASPGDPVMKARIQHTKEQGENPFFEYQLPQAAIALKQGAGRLIRGVDDQGVLVLCDPRVQTRNYGELFINSLPPMPITREVEEIISFFENKCD